ncbi:hypothetical protein [Campylobacter insulaenigrae]|uniref:Uncharacterized protein n=1 Tax=Campylobacter insulaenigrae NCTC 12927 TaxID=1031564 RepID=A0A0A8GZE5_9BACT|nr:hypothetical protein [Campylobacter insulaenigrae]AJC87136.1 hypothetical protein CINS_0131 [Campylobacter insulaenigrae NCTC 12927]MCR6591916.1 hypothetical protein [Campylobacter insulaenigrae]MCR6593403.1 hypothetical protein [Campylobacter insulaenigrae]MCR6594945.1 hypothetical protein [Campylobacter insulaenigrae]VEH92855.1 Uncharacterised protein [Campylobacter insulaenigrae]
MKNLLLIFENSILAAEKEQIPHLISELTFNLSYKKISTEYISNEILLTNFIQILEKLQLLNEENVTKIIQAITQARIENEKKVFFNYINELGKLKTKIEEQKDTIKNKICENFIDLENTLNVLNLKHFNISINDAMLYDIEILGLLQETAENAFITTLEKGEDIELTSCEIAKNLVFNAICEGEFESKRILDISKVVLNAAFDLANESKLFTYDLCVGVIYGTQEGISLAIDKFKSNFAYCALEQDLKQKEKELIDIEYEFIQILKDISFSINNPVKDILKDLLDNKFDTLFAKLKRLIQENREQILIKITELKQNPKIDDFSKFAQNKLNVLAKEFNELEKIASKKYKNLDKLNAKELGKRLWEKAKKIIKNKN